MENQHIIERPLETALFATLPQELFWIVEICRNCSMTGSCRRAASAGIAAPTSSSTLHRRETRRNKALDPMALACMRLRRGKLRSTGQRRDWACLEDSNV